MKTYEKAFSVAFIAIMLGCIVFRIESWPFSDWRVYSHQMQLKHVAFFEVRAIVDGRTVYPLDGNSLDLTIDRQFRHLFVDPPHPKINALCKEVIKDVLAYTPASRVSIIKYQVNDDMTKKLTEICSWSEQGSFNFEPKRDPEL